MSRARASMNILSVAPTRPRPATTRSAHNAHNARTVRHLERELLTLRAKGQVQHAIAEAREKGQPKTVKQLTQALRNIDKALDILGKQTTSNRRSQ